MAMKWTRVGVVSLLVVLVGASSIGWAEMSARERAIAERLKPIGAVQVGALPVAAQPSAGAAGGASGEAVYQRSCHTCHDLGVAGAPKIGDKAGWKARIATGMETLYKHALHGYKGMPAKGTCMSCTDDDIKKTVDYMVEKSRQRYIPIVIGNAELRRRYFSPHQAFESQLILGHIDKIGTPGEEKKNKSQIRISSDVGYIQKPSQNALIERFNRTYCEDILMLTGFELCMR